MKFLSRFTKSAPPPLPVPDEPGPLPPIIERKLTWSAPFQPVMLASGDAQVAALPLQDETEIALCPFAKPQSVAAECAHMGLRVVLLTISSNLRGEPNPISDETRSATIAHVLTGSPLTVDRWNTGLLFMYRLPDLEHGWKQTGLTGLTSKRVSRMIEAAELNLHLKLVRGDIRCR